MNKYGSNPTYSDQDFWKLSVGHEAVYPNWDLPLCTTASLSDNWLKRTATPNRSDIKQPTLLLGVKNEKKRNNNSVFYP